MSEGEPAASHGSSATVDTYSFARELEARLEGVDDFALGAPALADLFRMTYAPSREARALLNVIHRRLLARTIEHARTHTNFYVPDTYADPPAGGATEPPDLRCWPTTDRSDVIARLDDFIARDVTFESAAHTSGSTGPSITVYRSREELSFLWSYYMQLQRPTREARSRVPLILFLPNFYHGSGIPLPSAGKVFVSGVTDDTLIQDAGKVLQRAYQFPGHDRRVSIITGLSFHVKLLTLYLLEQGNDLTRFGVRALNVVGEYAPAIGRSFLEKAWQATVYDRFSLTESVGGAMRCLKCDHFHLDPHIVGEVLDTDNGQPIEAGPGYLVLTDLHPFVQMQPMLRYRTGDLVLKIESACANTLTFDFLGKAANCLHVTRNGKTTWLIPSARLHDIVSEIPDIRTFNTFPNLRSVRDTTLASPPIFSKRITTDQNKAIITLTFELRYAPEFFTERATEVRNRIVRSLCKEDPVLSLGVADGSVVIAVDFTGPGGLCESHMIKV
jgi:phenylacetate-coenzyme A ligase PaaK-like adenylate-forming protein